jgi:hypothetical protein
MPKIQKGARISDDDKKKIERLKKKGASKSELSTIRMALLRGDTWRKALTKGKAKRTQASAPPKNTRKEAEPVVEMEEVETGM